MIPRIQIENLLAALNEKQFDVVAAKLAAEGLADDLAADDIDEDTAAVVAHAIEEALSSD